MKLISLLSAGLFAAMSSLAINVQAADAAKTTEAAAPAAETQADKAPAAKTRRHSHMEEKTGMPMPRSATEAKPDKADGATPPAKKQRADKDRTRHYHPRDGK